MPFQNLTPLQSRFAATFAATLLLLALYLILFGSRLAYAADLVRDDGHSHRLVLGCHSAGNELQCVPESDLVDEPAVIQRAPAGLVSLGNNQYQRSNINIGETQWWVFPREAVNGPKSPPGSGLPASVSAADDSGNSRLVLDELKRRDVADRLSRRSTTVYISLNTCLKPEVNSIDASPGGPLPQLEVYISLSDSLTNPGPGIDSPNQNLYQADGGYMGTTVDADGDVFIAVAAPNTTAYSGFYNYDIAASIDGYFYSVDEVSPFLFFVDSDVNSALLVTDNVTQASPNSTGFQQWMNLTAPFTVFAYNTNDTATLGLEQSYCALSQLAQIRKGSSDIQAGMTSRGLGNKPKQQFHITGLNRSSTYYGLLAMEGNSTDSGNGVVGGGGKVWRPMNFSTKAGTDKFPSLDACLGHSLIVSS
jgi:calcium channel MID1